MSTASERLDTPRRRRSARRLTLIAGALLVASLGVAAPAWAAGAERPSSIIFDVGAEPSWSQELHGSGPVHDTAMDVAIATSGAVYVVGTLGDGGASHATLMKYVGGVPAWAAPKTYDGPYGGENQFMCAALGPGNTVYTAGISTGSNSFYDIVVVKWSASGALLWQKRYDSPSHTMDRVSTIGVDAGGNVTVAGVSFNGLIYVDGVIVSWSSSGVRRYTHRLNAPAGQSIIPVDLTVTSDNNVYVTGTTFNGPSEKALTIRLSASGDVKWSKPYTGPAGLGAFSAGVAARPGGGVYVGGGATSAAGDIDGLVMSYTKAGTRDVFALDTGPGGVTDQSFADIAVTSTSQVVATGSTINGGNSDCRTVVYTVDGTIAGGVTVPGAWSDSFVAVETDAFGGYYLAGNYHTAVDQTAFLVARGSVLTSGGGFASLWMPPVASTQNEVHALAVRGTTAVVVGAAWFGPAQQTDQNILGYIY